MKKKRKQAGRSASHCLPDQKNQHKMLLAHEKKTPSLLMVKRILEVVVVVVVITSAILIIKTLRVILTAKKLQEVQLLLKITVKHHVNVYHSILTNVTTMRMEIMNAMKQQMQKVVVIEVDAGVGVVVNHLEEATKAIQNRFEMKKRSYIMIMQVAKEDVEEGIIPTMASRCIISQSQEEVVVAKIVASMIETITKKVNIVKEIVVMMTVLT